jgi:hypothetical protein
MSEDAGIEPRTAVTFEYWQSGAVLRIRIRRIRMFFGLPDPDPLVRGPDPDPSILKLNF